MYGGASSLIEELDIGICPIVNTPGDDEDAAEEAHDPIVQSMEGRTSTPPGPFKPLKEHPDIESIVGIIARECPRIRRLRWTPYVTGDYAADIAIPSVMAEMSVEGRRAVVRRACQEG